MSWFRRKPKSEPRGLIALASDDEGNLYTEHCFAQPGDPWYGVTILMPSTIRWLRESGKLPLREITICQFCGRRSDRHLWGPCPPIEHE